MSPQQENTDHEAHQGADVQGVASPSCSEDTVQQLLSQAFDLHPSHPLFSDFSLSLEHWGCGIDAIVLGLGMPWSLAL